MKGSCSECGAAGSLSLFAGEASLKEAMAQALKLPREVQVDLLAYLGLFRPPQRSLSGARTLRLVRELIELVGAGTVQVDRMAARACPPRLWAEGMRQMITRKGGQLTHFENHTYLRKVVYALANAVSAAAESGPPKPAGKSHPEPEPESEAASAEALAAREELKALTQKLVGGLSLPKKAKAASASPAPTLDLRPCGECPACQAGVPSACTDRRLP